MENTSFSRVIHCALYRATRYKISAIPDNLLARICFYTIYPLRDKLLLGAVLREHKCNFAAASRIEFTVTFTATRQARVDGRTNLVAVKMRHE